MGALGCLFIAIVVVLTTGYWAPSLARWTAHKYYDVRLDIGELDLFPLGRTLLRDIRIGESGKAAALSIGQEEVAYGGLFSLLRGEVQSLSLEKVDIREEELYSLIEKMQSQTQTGGETLEAQEGAEAPLWMPDLTRLRSVRLIRPDGEVYALRSVDVRRVGRTGNQTLLETTLETGPIASMSALDIDSPLSLEARLEVGAEAVRLLGFQIDLGPLLKLKSDQESRTLTPERIAVGFEKVELDPDLWGEVLDLPLKDLDFKIQVPEAEFGMAIPSGGPWPRDFGEGAYFSSALVGLDDLKWENFLPDTALAVKRQDLDLKIAAREDFNHLWTRAEGSFQVLDFRAPEVSLEKANLNVVAHAQARENHYRSWATTRVSGGNLSVGDLALLVDLRAITDVDVETNAPLDQLLLMESYEALPMIMRSELNIYSIIEKEGDLPLTIASDNRLRFASKRLGEASTFTLSSTSQIDESRLSLAAEGLWTGGKRTGRPVSLDRLDVDLEYVALDRLIAAAESFAPPLGVRVKGNASSHLSANLLEEGDSLATGTVTVSGLSVAMNSATTHGKMADPLDLELSYSLSAPMAEIDFSGGIPYPSPLRLRHLGLNLGQDLSLEASGLLERDEPLPRAKILMAMEAKSLEKIAKTARDSGLDLPLNLKGSAALKGEVQSWSFDKSKVGLKGEGTLRLGDFSGKVEDLAEWEIADLLMPLKLGLSMPWNAKERSAPKTRLDFDLGRVTMDVDRIFGSGLQMLKSNLALSAKGYCEGRSPEKFDWFLESFQGEILDVAEIQGQGWGRWEGSGGEPSGGFSGEGPFSAHLSDLGAVASMLVANLKTTGTAAFENGKWNLEGETATLGGDLAMAISKGEYATDWLEWEDLKAALKVSVTDRLSSIGLSIPDHTLAGEIEIGKTLSSGLQLDDLRFRVDSSDGEFKVQTLDGELYGGDLVATATADLSRTTPTLSANLNVERLDLSTFCRQYRPGDTQMAGKVSLRADLSYDLGEMPQFEAEVRQVSNSILMDRPTVNFLMFGYAKLFGADIPPDTVAAMADFRKIFGRRSMVPFSSFVIKVRYSAPHFQFSIQMENKNFSLLLEPKIDEGLVFDFLQSQQRALLARVVAF